MSKPSDKTLEMMAKKLDPFADLRAQVTQLAMEEESQIKGIQAILDEEEELLPLLDIERQALELKARRDVAIAERLDDIADEGERAKWIAEHEAWKEEIDLAILVIQSDPRYARALAVKARRQGKEERKVQELENGNAKILDGMDHNAWQKQALEALDTVRAICDKTYGRNEGSKKFWSLDKWRLEARKVLSNLLVKSYGLQPEGKCFTAFLDSQLKRLEEIRLEIKNARKEAERLEAAKKTAEVKEVKVEEPTMEQVVSQINDVPLSEPVAEDKPAKKGVKKGGRKPPVDKEDEAGFEKAVRKSGKNRK